jgi:hypothetical protein
VNLPPRPVGDLPLWDTVMTTAGHCCQCTGQCGNRHTATQGRCDRQHGNHPATVPLLAAPATPADMTLPTHTMSALPARRLAAWCRTCHDATRARALRTARTSAPPPCDDDALFVL